jgi:hypothetical protein
MALAIPDVHVNGGMKRRISPGDVMGGGENILAGSISTAGSGTWTGAAIATGIIRRTGPGAGYTDTTDTSSNIVAALAGNAVNMEAMAGQTFRLLFINTVAQAMTFAAGTGVVAGTGTLGAVASIWREYLVTIVNASPPVTVSGTLTNGSAAVTFVLPPGMTSLPIGSAPNAVNITPGMGVNATSGVTAGTTVSGVTQGQGGVTGITMSGNATASTVIPLNFTPTVQFDSLRSGTL